MSAAPKLTLVTKDASSGGGAVDDRALADLGRDDIGNAERLIARHGEDLRRTSGLGVLAFDGQRWRLDPDQAAALRRAQLTARAIRLEGRALEKEFGNTEDKDELKRIEAHQKWAVASANNQRLNAMLAQAWPHLDLKFEAWNGRPALFNVGNGTLDLSGAEPKLEAHRRGDLITHMAGVDYDPDAECPEFRAFIDRVLPAVKLPEEEGGAEDRSLQRFVQRTLGVCLIDSCRDQALVMHHGGGANGKSTLLNAVCDVLGDYAMTVAVESLLHNKNQSGSSSTPDIARLAEKPRLIRVSEPEPGAQLGEGGVKAMTGGEPIVARANYQNPLEFEIVGKIHLSCNNRLSVRGGDDGIWRRILLVPWKVQIPEAERREKGPALEAALKREAPGILNWLIEGLVDYYERGGLDPPDVVKAETLEYRTDSDVIGRFIGEACVKGDGLEVEAGELYDAFKIWSKEEGAKEPLSASLVGRRLTDRGFGKRKSSGFVYRAGLDLDIEWKAKVRSNVADAEAKKKARAAETAGDDAPAADTPEGGE